MDTFKLAISSGWFIGLFGTKTATEPDENLRTESMLNRSTSSPIEWNWYRCYHLLWNRKTIYTNTKTVSQQVFTKSKTNDKPNQMLGHIEAFPFCRSVGSKNVLIWNRCCGFKCACRKLSNRRIQERKIKQRWSVKWRWKYIVQRNSLWCKRWIIIPFSYFIFKFNPRI